MTDTERATIIEVLCSQALADHLGDVRDAEAKLWDLIGVPALPWDDPAYNYNSYEAWPITRARIKAAGLSLPDHLSDSDEEE